MKSSWLQFSEYFRELHQRIEKNVADEVGSYKDLSFEALYTSQEDYRKIFSHPEIQGTMVDLGCGVGVGCFTYHELYPNRTSIGVEFTAARYQAAETFRQTHDLQGISFLHQDLLTCEIPFGDTYFLYFPTGAVLDRILSVLSSRPFKTLVAIESHGDLLPRLALENWLTSCSEIHLSSTRHCPHARIFTNNSEPRSGKLWPFDLSFVDQVLEISSPEGHWLGESFQMEWQQGELFNLKTPPRTIAASAIQRTWERADLERNIQLLLRLRHLGEVEVELNQRRIKGMIRKIFISPSFALELSGGEKVEWKDIQTISQGSQICYDYHSSSS